jgi:ketosteroid isomerase-like protein
MEPTYGCPLRLNQFKIKRAINHEKLLLVLVFVLKLSDGALATDVKLGDAELTIRKLERQVNDAYAANNLKKYFGYYAEHAILIFYDKRTDVPAYRKMWTSALKSEPIEAVRLSDMNIRVLPSSDTVIASYQIDIRTSHPEGVSTDEHAFETDLWSKLAGAWKLVHVHFSTT